MFVSTLNRFFISASDGAPTRITATPPDNLADIPQVERHVPQDETDVQPDQAFLVLLCRLLHP
jgi:hypothetical protein